MIAFWARHPVWITRRRGQRFGEVLAMLPVQTFLCGKLINWLCSRRLVAPGARRATCDLVSGRYTSVQRASEVGVVGLAFFVEMDGVPNGDGESQVVQ